jgi:hypothetical protein
VALVGLAALALTACSGGGGGGSGTESVFAVRVGQCFKAPSTVHTELSSLSRTPCDKPHAQEAYAAVNYVNQKDPASTAYPGSDVLTTFANGKCAQLFKGYVGTDYLDSKLFFTYLIPSARSWEQGVDRRVLCFVTSTGSLRTASAKGSKE